MRTLVADRFWPFARGRWRDVVTGIDVDVRVSSAPRSRPERETQARAVDPSIADPTLVDWGELGTHGWFEAFGQDARGWPRSDPERERADVQRIVVSVDRPRPAGARVVATAGTCLAESPRAQSALARALRGLGFALVSPRHVTGPAIARALAHRHLVVLLAEPADRDAAIRWVRRLHRTRLRSHVVLDLGPEPGLLRAVLAREARPTYAARRDPASLAAAGRFSMTSCESPLLEALPHLLERLSQADDDHQSLSAACRWVVQQAGADAASVVASATGRSLAAATRTGAAPAALQGAPDTRPGARPLVTIESGGATVAAPIRHAGVVVAHLVVRGDPAVVETLAALARTVAPAVAASARGRLDQVAAAAIAPVVPELLGAGPAIRGVREAIARAAPTPFPVLIEGESGTGKELVARALHRLSARRDRRFCAVNCAALADELVEAELFGHARGAFTGAVDARVGLFEEADGGTLFLDEVAELSGRAQAKLLRTLQEREVRRVGENVPRRVDVRVVAATNRPLAAAAAAGLYREDLVFRLAVIRLVLPPLRERLEDVPLLALAFWRQAAADARTQARLGPDALAALCRHAWPGNVRELQNVMAGLALAAPPRGRVGARLVAGVLTAAATDAEPVVPLDTARRQCERRVIAASLARHQGRRTAAARELGLTRQGLRKAMRRVGLDDADRAEGVA